jgi:type IV secretion system protein VirD4
MSQDTSDGYTPLATGGVIPSDDLDRNGYFPGDFWLGRTLNGQPFGWREDLNLLTCAGPRSGKGVGTVVPNLMEFPGSAIVVDPKGELADLTADYRRRRHNQKVIVLDPAGVCKNLPDDLRGTFNPFDELSLGSEFAISTAQSVASGIVVPDPNSQDKFWDQTALSFIKSLILYMVVHYPPEDRTLMKLRETASAKGDQSLFQSFLHHMRKDDPDYTPEPKKAFDLLLQEMSATEEFGGIVGENAASVAEMGEQTRGNVLGNIRTHLSFLDEDRLWDVLRHNPDPERTFRLDELRRQDRHLTVYLCLPVDMMQQQGRWIRLIISQIIQFIERTQSAFDKDQHLPVLMMLDEFYQLGPMPSIVNTLTYAPGAGLRLWLIVQDLNQLKQNYPKAWETIIGACGIKQFFGINELTTAKYVSELIGQREIVVPSVTLTETKNTTTGENVSETEGRSLSDAEGWTSSRTLGSSETDTTGSSYSHSDSVGLSHSTSAGTSSSHGTNSGGSSSTGWNTGAGQNINRNAMGGLPNQLDGHSNLGGSSSLSAGFNGGSGENWGSNDSSGTNRNTSSGISSTSSDTYGTSTSRAIGHSESDSFGLSGGRTWAANTSATVGRSLSASTGSNYGVTFSLQTRSVFRPEELLDAFTKDNLLQLVHIRDQGGMVLYRTPYYADLDFVNEIAEYDRLAALGLTAGQEQSIPLDLAENPEKVENGR